jgi:uncharacterized protein YcaQ
MRAGVQQLYQFDEKRRSLELEEIKLAMCRGIMIFQVDPVTVVAAASQAPVISRSRAGPGHS